MTFPDPRAEIAYRMVGAPGAARTVVVLRSGALAMTDPDPPVTRRFDVHLFLIDLDGEEMSDPPAFGGETPAGSTAAEIVALLDEIAPDGAVGLVAEHDAAHFAVSFAAEVGPRIDRLVLVAPPLPPTALARDITAQRLARISADVQVIEAVPSPSEAAAWYAERLPVCEVVDGLARNVHGGRLALTAVWPGVLAHVARGAARV
ncbi:hypothetical protein ACTU3I_16240 [Microbacterium sp. RD1]|uniref:hypothetical protein n=1 Tax=Microbacterium sp. RD1 TaxID=3457313 RepID=UPI003FA5F9DF